MKHLFKILLCGLILFNISCGTARESVRAERPAYNPNPQGYVSFQVFYDNLSPYGHWINHPVYGYIWTPEVEYGFSPYETAGHWVWTEYGWTWVSDYPWGWAPFHYGRWDFDDFYGWFWIPDEVWGPAWVCWRQSPGYYGWAPLGPGISMEYAHGGRWHPHDDRWVFLEDRHMGEHDIHRYYAPRGNNVTIIRTSTIINNTYEDKGRHHSYASGPRREEVQKATGQDIRPIEVKESSRPEQSVDHDRLTIYRPEVNRKAEAGREVAPPKVEKMEDVKRSRENQREKAPEQNARPAEQPRQNNPRMEERNSAPQPNRTEPRIEQPRQEQPRMEQPRQEQPRMEQPRQEERPAPRIEQPRQEPAPRMEQPRQEQRPAPRMEQPRQQERPAPRMEAPRQQAPRQQSAPRQSAPAPRQQSRPQAPGNGR